uniref:Uncharacterized protein n=1 Tax=Varanus komodoensis TaxID=61221 RepID=A0A8D2IUC4_VARKO
MIVLGSRNKKDVLIPPTAQIVCCFRHDISVVLSKFGDTLLPLTLGGVKATFHLCCIPDALDFSPGEGDLVKIYQLQGENAKVAVHEIFQQVYHLFSQDRTELAWDEPSVRDLLNGLDQEIERLESCLSAGRYTYNIRRTVKRYFQQLSSFLEGKEYATCAWTIVQKRVEKPAEYSTAQRKMERGERFQVTTSLLPSSLTCYR